MLGEACRGWHYSCTFQKGLPSISWTANAASLLIDLPCKAMKQAARQVSQCMPEVPVQSLSQSHSRPGIQTLCRVIVTERAVFAVEDKKAPGRTFCPYSLCGRPLLHLWTLSIFKHYHLVLYITQNELNPHALLPDLHIGLKGSRDRCKCVPTGKFLIWRWWCIIPVAAAIRLGHIRGIVDS